MLIRYSPAFMIVKYAHKDICSVLICQTENVGLFFFLQGPLAPKILLLLEILKRWFCIIKLHGRTVYNKHYVTWYNCKFLFVLFVIMTQNPTLGLIGQLRWVVYLCTTILTLTSIHTYNCTLEIGVETLYMTEGVSEQDIEYSLKAKTQ